MGMHKSLFGPFFGACLGLALGLGLAATAHAETVKAAMYQATEKGRGESLGEVTFSDSPQGLEVQTNLHGLPPGQHGFHVHEKADCGPAEVDGKMTPGMAAGGHYDPAKTGSHLGPDKPGHLGDLPVLTAAPDGTAKMTMLVKDAKAAEFKGHALMIHAGGDNYSDQPVALGGGGARIGCGIIE